MPKRTVHVIGRGIAGLSLGYEFVRRGWQVTLIGPGEVSTTATWAAVGVSSLKGQFDPAKPLFAAKVAGHESLPGWLRELQVVSGRRIQVELGGVIEPFFSAGEYSYIRERVFHRSFNGCFRADMLSPQEVLSRWPEAARLEVAPCGAFSYVRDLWFDPDMALAALNDVLGRSGARFVDDAVLRVDAVDQQYAVVTTAQGALPPAVVVLAAGIGSAGILQRSGLPDLGLVAVAGETLHGPTPPGAHAAVRIGKINLAQAGGRYRLGSTSRRCGLPVDEYVDSADWSALEALGTRAFGCLPSDSVRVGLRARLRDQAPAVGPLYGSGASAPLWLCLGFYKSGLQLAPLFARKLVRKIEGYGDHGLDPVFSPRRFLP